MASNDNKAELSVLKSNRKYVRQSVTRKFNQLEENISEMPAQNCKQLLGTFNGFQNKLSELNEKIGTVLLQIDENFDMEEEQSVGDIYDDKVFEAINMIEYRITNISSTEQNNPNDHDSQNVHASRNKLKLPELPLPSFSNNEGESLIQFFINFEAIIDKYDLSNFERYIYLEKQLSDEPLVLVKSLTGTKRCYSEAKDLLNQAFARPIKQKFETIRRMNNLKFIRNEPYKFVSDVRLLLSSIEDLQIDVDTIAQYFVWSAIPPEYQTELLHITNSCNPTLEEIQKGIFECIERTQDKCKVKNNLKSISLAANIDVKPDYNKSNSNSQSSWNTSFKPCQLCSNKTQADHPIFKCSKYSTPKLKLAKLRELNLCTKCGGIKHKASECKYRFKKTCDHCSRTNHFSFLCVNDNAQKVTNNTCSVEITSLPTKCIEGNLLPTFSCKILDGSSLRTLQDSGAQTSFIRSDIATANDFRILQNDIVLTVKGFNSKKIITTNLVEVVVLISDVKCYIPAVCVPVLTASSAVKGAVKIAEALVEKGYTLADEYTRSNPSKPLDMILGVDSFHLLNIQTISFGTASNKSCMFSSAFGVLPIGNGKKFLGNIKHLPRRGEETSTREILSTKVEIDEMFSESEMDSENCVELSNLFISCDTTFSNLEESVYESDDPKLLDHCARILNYDEVNYDEGCVINEKETCKKILEKITHDNDGRLTVPMLWHDKNSHLLGQNLNLSRKILHSIKSKISKIPDGLSMVNKVIKDQLDSNVIEQIDDLAAFVNKNPDCKFLSHMPVFKPSSNTTKCRVVYLSNLSEKDRLGKLNLSHNQSMVTGPQLNRPIAISLTLLRFDQNLMTYDLQKAFLQLKLSPTDQEKLCFLWFRDVENHDYSLVAYKCLRLIFGARCSPSLLMLALYYMLIYSVDENDELKQFKRHLYELLYMDNGAVSSVTSLVPLFEQLQPIFEKFGFKLQEFVTNDKTLIEKYPEIFSEPMGKTKLLGITWDTLQDTLSPPKFKLDASANTKRLVLSSIASNYDIFNIGGPILNRARIFMHELQCKQKLKWDDKLDPQTMKCWVNICHQVNTSPEISIPRFVGNRSEKYELIGYVDASKMFYGAVLYIKEVTSSKLTFLCAKNRLITNNLKAKSIASLELLAVEFGTQLLHEYRSQLSGPKTCNPIDITKMKLFSDSSISLNWLAQYSITYKKMNKISVFNINRLKNVEKICSEFPIEFSHVAGKENPADCITRPISYNVLSKSKYWVGPELPSELDKVLTVTIPNPRLEVDENIFVQSAVVDNPCTLPLVESNRFNSYQKHVRVVFNVLSFINKLKAKVKLRNIYFRDFKPIEPKDLLVQAHREIIIHDQHVNFPDLHKYFNSNKNSVREIPELISKLNIFVDNFGMMRVKCKISHIGKSMMEFPILLAKSSALASSIILDVHQKMHHAGKYSVCNQFRKEFFISSCFNTVRRILKSCVVCRKMNNQTVKCNQNSYRDFRSDPVKIPFRTIFIDYIGPFHIKVRDQHTKVYILILTCLFSRGIALQVCLDLSLKNFLRAFQLHVFRHGLPSLCLSDQGSQITSGSKIISDHLQNADAIMYMQSNGIEKLCFSQYAKGCNKLGGLVDTCVKMVKRLVYGAIRNNVIGYSDFEYLVAEATHVINRRPIGFLEALRDSSVDELLPVTLTPEMIIYGHELISLNVIPDLERDSQNWTPDAHITMHNKLGEIRGSMLNIYYDEFINTLVKQATNLSKRYVPKNHTKLSIGDIVLIKDDLIKRSKLPMAIVTAVEENSLGEVVSATLRKGGTKELTRRHVSNLIPILMDECKDINRPPSPHRSETGPVAEPRQRSKRSAAAKSVNRNRELATQGLV